MDYFDEVSDVIQSMIDDYKWGDTTITGREIYMKLDGELQSLRERYPYVTTSFDQWFIEWADLMIQG